MIQHQQQQQVQTQREVGTDYYNDPGTQSGLSLRLDTRGEIVELYCLLAGKRIATRKNEDGTFSEVLEPDPYSQAKLSQEGVASVMGFMRSMISPHTAQGDKSDNDYRTWIRITHKKIARTLFRNRPKWGVSPENFPLLCSTITGKLNWFLSRSLDDGERRALINQMRILETNVKQREGDEKKHFLGN